MFDLSDPAGWDATRATVTDAIATLQHFVDEWQVPLAELRMVVVGAGSAGVGIARQTVAALVAAGQGLLATPGTDESGPLARALRKLADADALGSLGKARRNALWEVRRTPSDQLPLFAFADAAELGHECDAALPAMPLAEEVVADYQTTRLSLKAHPVQFLRATLAADGVLSCADANGRDIARPAHGRIHIGDVRIRFDFTLRHRRLRGHA